MEKDKASALLKKYHEGNCTPEEARLLFQAFNRVPLPDQTSPSDQAYHALETKTLARIHQKIGTKKTRILPRLWPYAAAILLVVSVYFYFGSDADRWQPIAASEVAPGTHRALLTLADGQTIDLSADHTGIVIGAGIAYLDGSQISDKRYSATQLMALTTPKGGTYQVTLPDGTQVWLNAESTLRYPSQFTGDTRDVQLVGEAYFSVQKDASRPFIVRSQGQEVEVLGTAFNVSAYPDDPETKTTLVEGSVRLKADATSAHEYLVPGEQGVLVDGTITKTQVNTEPYTAWKDGYFRFNGDLAHIMAQIGRWYNVDVVFGKGVDSRMEIVGRVSRDKKLVDILRTLQEIDPTLKFKVEAASGDTAERRLTLMK